MVLNFISGKVIRKEFRKGISCIKGIISLKTASKLSEVCKFKDAEPSTFYLIVGRIMSIILLVVIWFVILN